MNIPIQFDLEAKGGGKVENQLKGIEKYSANTNQHFKGITDKFKSLSGQAGDKLKGLFGGLNSSIGSSVEGLSKMGGAIGAVAAGAAAFATSIYQASVNYDKLDKQFKGYGGNIDKRVGSAITSSIKSIADIDDKELQKAVKVLSNEYSINKLSALQLIREAVSKGLSADEGIDQIVEYTSQFKKLGYTATETLGLITKSSLEGWYTDKAADTIKEAGLRLRELPTATKAALKSAGIDVAAFQSNLANGTLSMDEAIEMVSKKMVELGENSQITGTLIADVFGSPGEDVSFGFFEAIAQGNNDLAQMAVQISDLEKSSMRLASSWDVFKTSVNVGGLAEGMNDFMTSTLQFLTYLSEVFPAKFENVFTTIGNKIKSTIADIALLLSKIALTDSKKQFYRVAYNDLTASASMSQTASDKRLADAKNRYATLIKAGDLQTSAAVSKRIKSIQDANASKQDSIDIKNTPVGGLSTLNRGNVSTDNKSGSQGSNPQRENLTVNIQSLIGEMNVSTNIDLDKVRSAVERVLNEAVINAKQLR